MYLCVCVYCMLCECARAKGGDRQGCADVGVGVCEQML